MSVLLVSAQITRHSLGEACVALLKQAIDEERLQDEEAGQQSPKKDQIWGLRSRNVQKAASWFVFQIPADRIVGRQLHLRILQDLDYLLAFRQTDRWTDEGLMKPISH
jgi:hypothetical protein